MATESGSGWSAERCLAEGEALLSESKPGEAEAMFQQAVALKPQDPYARCQLAVALLEQGKSVEAIESADGALQIADGEWPHRLKAIALNRLMRRREAVEEAERAVARAPESLPNKELLLDLLMSAGMTTPAAQLVAGLMEAAPQNAKYPYIAGKIAIQRMQFVDAERNLRRAVEIDPTFEAAWNDLGVALSRQGKRADAIDAFGSGARFDATWQLPRKNIEALVDRRAGIAGIVAFLLGLFPGAWLGENLFPGSDVLPLLAALLVSVAAMFLAFSLTRLQFRNARPDLAGLYREQHRSTRFRRIAYLVYVIGSLPLAAGLAWLVSFIPVIGPALAASWLLVALVTWRFGAPQIWRRWILPRLM